MLTWYGEHWPWLTEIFRWAALLPVTALIRHRGAWPVAAAFAVSWVADTAVMLGVPSPVVSATYPVLQCGMLYGLFAPTRLAVKLAIATAVIAGITAGFGSYSGPDALLRIFTAAALVWIAPPPYRATVVVYFGLGAVCWTPLVLLPGASLAFLLCFLAYQTCRLTGLALLTVAVWREHRNPRPPDLRVGP